MEEETSKTPPTSQKEDKKRKMKTPLQLETLERAFAEEKYPSEAIRARLSIQLGLSNRQLKMWFCHRRLKERKAKEEDQEEEEEEPAISSDRSPQLHLKATPSQNMQKASTNTKINPPSIPPKKEEQLSSGSYHSKDEKDWKIKRREGGYVDKDSGNSKKKRIVGREEAAIINRSMDRCRIAELRAIASVEAQLGEPLREDSPCLGIEFDPLPTTGAFTSPPVSSQQQDHWKSFSSQDLRSRVEDVSIGKADIKLQRDPFYLEHNKKSARNRKSMGMDSGQNVSTQLGSRLLQEYKFIPERPSGRDGVSSKSQERSTSSKVFLGSESSISGFMLQRGLMQGHESHVNAFGFDEKPLNASGGNLIMQSDMHNNFAFAQPRGSHHQDAFRSFSYEGQFGGYNGLYNVMPPGTSSVHGIGKHQTNSEEELMHGSKKRKSEETRVIKDVEFQRKRMQKDVELARWKRGEQLQKDREKETERVMREKQREDERIQRERLREDERVQREVKREMERQERFLQKEAQRLEREREKEEARKLKEATRLKAAIERATARRLARECVELIDDERLELLEAAASSHGLPSIYLLDGDTLKGLDRYKESLKKFPPLSVKMKNPLGISPWIDSQQNLGNLFMVWKFLIAFADVLGLWPFTLDEFVQAFHDYDPRLLAEIHISLIRTMLRDIEDVGKVSAYGGAVNQYTAPSTIGGGHSQLVESALAWGFDYREWSRCLNPLTWPEILRQFSLAAGYGPIWKQQAEVINVPVVDDGLHAHQKGHGAEQNMRSVSKAKVGSNSRKCGYRLTPGTVKYAAFHVLSVEGPNGLPITEIADRIEKYGLRDLSTTKTPESSITAALSRDTIFFERVAPSTYCVKSQFRKNPEDAERLLQAAVEKTRLFQSGPISDTYDVEKDTEGIDEVDREQVSDDESDGMDVDNADRGKVPCSLKQGKVIETEGKAGYPITKVKKPELVDKRLDSVQMHDDKGKHASLPSLISTNALVDGRATSLHLGKDVDSNVDTEIDESHAGEPWVQGLMEGEYSELSVEERLNALVALVEAVNEGNTIRVALEDRMEAATALKRQMWAEAQQDKRRSKEEQVSKVQAAEGSRMGPCDGDVKSLETASVGGTKHHSHLDKESGLPSHQDASAMGISGASSEKTRAQLKVDIDFRADELYVFRSQPLGMDRRHNRYWQFITAYITEDPGCGRVYFESSEDGHWEVIDTAEAFSALMESLDTRGVREAHLHGVLQKLENLIRQGMTKLSSCSQRLLLEEGKVMSSNNGLASTNVAGYTSEDGSSESGTVFQDSGSFKCRGSIQVQNGSIQTERNDVFEWYKEFEKWIWSMQTPEFSDLIAMRIIKRSSELLVLCEMCHDFYWPQEKQCSCCHTAFENAEKLDAKSRINVNEYERKRGMASSVKLLPPRLQVLKAQILSIEAAIPMEAINSSWTESQRKAWGASLKHASSPSELLQLLTELEGATKRDWLSSSFGTTKELLEDTSLDVQDGSNVLPWVPRTTAAVALRLQTFDAALFYDVEQKKQHSSFQIDTNQKASGLASSKKVLNLDAATFEGGSDVHKDPVTKDKKERDQISEVSRPSLVIKVSRSRYEKPAQDKEFNPTAEYKHSTIRNEERTLKKGTHEWENFRDNGTINQTNGQMHYDNEEEENTSGAEEEDEEVIIEDEYDEEGEEKEEEEEEDDAPLEELDQAKEQTIVDEEQPDTDSMEEDIDNRDEERVQKHDYKQDFRKETRYDRPHSDLDSDSGSGSNSDSDSGSDSYDESD